MPKVGMQPIRRQQLIHATLSAVNELGFADASIIQIAQRAGVSTGIISHYFKGKHGLIEATMRYLLQQLADSIASNIKVAENTPEQRLMAIVKANFSSSQTDKAAMKTWLEFWTNSLHQPNLQRLQNVNHHRLHSNIKFEFSKKMPTEQAEIAAQGLAALIDGFWLRGALMKTSFNTDIPIQICSEFIYRQFEHFVA